MSGSEWNFLKDIKSLLMTSWKKIRCIVFSIVKTDNDYMQNHLFELSATEIENFKLTGKIYHIHIKSRISYEKSDKINILLDDSGTSYIVFKKFNPPAFFWELSKAKDSPWS